MKISAIFLSLLVFYTYNAEKSKIDPEKKQQIKLLELPEEIDGIVQAMLKGIVYGDMFFREEEKKDQEELAELVQEYCLSRTFLRNPKLINKLLDHGIIKKIPESSSEIDVQHNIMIGIANSFFRPENIHFFNILYGREHFYVGWKINRKMLDDNKEEAYEMVKGFAPWFLHEREKGKGKEYVEIDKINMPTMLKTKVITLQRDFLSKLEKQFVTFIDAEKTVHELTIIGAICHYKMSEKGPDSYVVDKYKMEETQK
jgi:hypothetical protein